MEDGDAVLSTLGMMSSITQLGTSPWAPGLPPYPLIAEVRSLASHHMDRAQFFRQIPVHKVLPVHACYLRLDTTTSPGCLTPASVSPVTPPAAEQEALSGP